MNAIEFVQDGVAIDHTPAVAKVAGALVVAIDVERVFAFVLPSDLEVQVARGLLGLGEFQGASGALAYDVARVLQVKTECLS